MKRLFHLPPLLSAVTLSTPPLLLILALWWMNGVLITLPSVVNAWLFIAITSSLAGFGRAVSLRGNASDRSNPLSARRLLHSVRNDKLNQGHREPGDAISRAPRGRLLHFVRNDRLFQGHREPGDAISRAPQGRSLHSVRNDRLELQLPLTTILLVLLALSALVALRFSETDIAGWIFLTSFFAALLSITSGLVQYSPWWARTPIEVFSALLAGSTPVIVEQINTQFAAEEFFVALEILALLGIWVALRLVNPLWPRLSLPWNRAIRINKTVVMGVLLTSVIILTGLTLRAYQHSFFSPTAPQFPGISENTPYICGAAAASADRYSGEQVGGQILSQVAANPDKSTPEYGLLALLTGEDQWAQQFRQSILSEASQGRYTQPANSVKYDQYLAGKRAYYYARIKETFPDLFSPSEETLLEGWFAAINRRAFTVEWVDWLYAAAFSYWPQGPYENQETGLGLLSILEFFSLSDPNLRDRNQAFLSGHLQGWRLRFRNTDDALIYQPEWIENAWFQALYTGAAGNNNTRLAFEWLKLQALPDGSPFGYNHIYPVSLAEISYFGASLLDDEELLWVAGRAAEYASRHDLPLSGQPGIEAMYSGLGRAPASGSCLLYGNSGLPNQSGPLAPDKIVFRSGWDADASYLLLNLRFTGWHRYKATNTITLLYKNGPRVVEKTSGQLFKWLPAGRSLFRDKRIPREYLNGLNIGRTGIGSVIFSLTGFGSQWAQDPPHFAEVSDFRAGESVDTSTSAIKNWHGWDHERRILFYHAGPIVVIDAAQGPYNRLANLRWHLTPSQQISPDRFRWRNGPQVMEAMFLPLENTQLVLDQASSFGQEGLNRVEYRSSDGRSLRTATLFLPGKWAEARVELSPDGSGLEITLDDEHLSIALEN